SKRKPTTPSAPRQPKAPGVTIADLQADAASGVRERIARCELTTLDPEARTERAEEAFEILVRSVPERLHLGRNRAAVADVLKKKREIKALVRALKNVAPDPDVWVSDANGVARARQLAEDLYGLFDAEEAARSEAQAQYREAVPPRGRGDKTD